MPDRNEALKQHPRCAAGARCVISVAGGGAYLSRLWNNSLYCYPCQIAKDPQRVPALSPNHGDDKIDMSLVHD